MISTTSLERNFFQNLFLGNRHFDLSEKEQKASFQGLLCLIIGIFFLINVTFTYKTIDTQNLIYEVSACLVFFSLGVLNRIGFYKLTSILFLVQILWFFMRVSSTHRQSTRAWGHRWPKIRCTSPKILLKKNIDFIFLTEMNGFG